MEKIRPVQTRLVVLAPDKLRGTATAREAAATMAAAAAARGWATAEVPLSDGGEGLLEAVGGANRTTTVTGPLSAPVAAGWRLDGTVAVVECAEASGLLLAGGAGGNDPVRATSRGTGELIAAALAAGATEVVVGLGGSACTDGGYGALEALPHGLGGARVTVCCDVETRYLDAARVYGPQKGADAAVVDQLARRLVRQRADLVHRYGVDPQELPGSGAAGGLAGGLAALGATLASGFDHVAALVGLDEHLAGADLVITGEGRLDPSSVRGKVVGGVVARARALGVPVVAVVGDRDPAFTPDFDVCVLTEEHGPTAALEDTHRCLAATVDRLLR